MKAKKFGKDDASWAITRQQPKPWAIASTSTEDSKNIRRRRSMMRRRRRSQSSKGGSIVGVSSYSSVLT
jgi:hypothetical protein